MDQHFLPRPHSPTTARAPSPIVSPAYPPVRARAYVITAQPYAPAPAQTPVWSNTYRPEDAWQLRMTPPQVLPSPPLPASPVTPAARLQRQRQRSNSASDNGRRSSHPLDIARDKPRESSPLRREGSPFCRDACVSEPTEARRDSLPESLMYSELDASSPDPTQLGQRRHRKRRSRRRPESFLNSDLLCDLDDSGMGTSMTRVNSATSMEDNSPQRSRVPSQLRTIEPLLSPLAPMQGSCPRGPYGAVIGSATLPSIALVQAVHARNDVHSPTLAASLAAMCLDPSPIGEDFERFCASVKEQSLDPSARASFP